MAKPVKGSKAVDEQALRQNQETCQYVRDNLHELSQEVLMGLIEEFDQTKVHINRILDVRLKQGQGGKFVGRIQVQIGKLDNRIANLEQKFGETGKEATEEVSVTEQ